MKIVHISDIHIKSAHQEHEISKKGFNSLFEKIKEANPDYIIIAGDIIHNKLSITSELVHMIFWFLDELKKCSNAPIDILLGNHDYNVKNLDRKDIFSVLQKKNKLPEGINIIKEETTIDYVNNFSFHYLPNHMKTLSEPNDPSRINILVYHGQVLSSVAENGFKFPTGTFSVDDFKNYDYGFLGDIHKKQFLTEKIAYSGSLFQQDFGESLKKGFLLWDIRDKNDFDVKFVQVQAGSNYYTLRYKEDGLCLDQEIREGSKVRIISKSPLTLKDKEEIIKMLKDKTKEIQFIVEVNDEIKNSLKKSIENLNNSESQKKLIKQYCDDNKIDAEPILKTFDDILKEIDPQKISKAYTWFLDKLNFENYFSYAEDNEIDFNKLSGVIGIVGENFSGKTSLLDILTYALHTQTIRFHSKASDLINTRKVEAASFSVLVNENNNRLEIDRKLLPVKQKKKTYSKNQTLISLDGVNITQEDEIENRKTLQGLIGKDDDFLTLSVMSYDRNDISVLYSTPAVLKDLLRRMFSIDVFDIFDELAKKKISAEEKEERIFERQLEILNENPKTASQVNEEIDSLSTRETQILNLLELIKKSKEGQIAIQKISELPCGKEYQSKCHFCKKILEDSNNDISNNLNEQELYNELRVVRASLGESNNSLAELNSINKQKNDLIDKIKDCQSNVQKYKEFRQVVGRDGLPSIILNQSLKTLECTINNILSGLVDFQVSIETSDIDNCVYIYLIDSRKKIAYMGSGMEKFIIELSMRMALSQLCRIPHLSVFLMDEVFNTISQKNKSILPDIFSKMKENFKHVIIISQDPDVLNCADHIIHVCKNEDDTSIVG